MFGSTGEMFTRLLVCVFPYQLLFSMLYIFFFVLVTSFFVSLFLSLLPSPSFLFPSVQNNLSDLIRELAESRSATNREEFDQRVDEFASVLKSYLSRLDPRNIDLMISSFWEKIHGVVSRSSPFFLLNICQEKCSLSLIILLLLCILLPFFPGRFGWLAVNQFLFRFV